MKILKILSLALVVLAIGAIILLYEGDIPKDVIDARYSSPASQFLDLGHAGRIHYRDEGNRRDEAVILLHGANTSLHIWEPWVEQLSDRYRIITLDLPGHGLTGEVPSADYSHKAYVDVVSAIATHLGINRFVLAGNSMGGSVSWHYALANQDQLRGLALIDSDGLPDWYRNDDRGSAVVAFKLLSQGWFHSFAERVDPYYMTVQRINAAYNNNADIIDDDLIMRYYDLNMRAGTRRATLERFGQTWSGDTPDLTLIKVPTLIMWGMADQLTPFSHAARFEELIPDTVTAYYEDVGHIPMEEVPVRSADDFTRFLESLEKEDQENHDQP